MFDVGECIGGSLSAVRELSQSEITLWCAHILRKKGVPVGDEKAMEKLAADVKKSEFDRETSEIKKSITWA